MIEKQIQLQLLQKELHKELLKAAKEAKSIGYNPTLFNQMLTTEGGYSSAKKLINKILLELVVDKVMFKNLFLSIREKNVKRKIEKKMIKNTK